MQCYKIPRTFAYQSTVVLAIVLEVAIMVLCNCNRHDHFDVLSQDSFFRCKTKHCQEILINTGNETLISDGYQGI